MTRPKKGTARRIPSYLTDDTTQGGQKKAGGETSGKGEEGESSFYVRGGQPPAQCIGPSPLHRDSTSAASADAIESRSVAWSGNRGEGIRSSGNGRSVPLLRTDSGFRKPPGESGRSFLPLPTTILLTTSSHAASDDSQRLKSDSGFRKHNLCPIAPSKRRRGSYPTQT